MRPELGGAASLHPCELSVPGRQVQWPRGGAPEGRSPSARPPPAPSTPLLSLPLPRLPQPPVASDPAAGSPRSSGARAPTSGDTLGPDPGGHPRRARHPPVSIPYPWPATLGPGSSLGGGRVPRDPGQLRVRRWRNRSARARTRSPPLPAPSQRTSPPPAAASPTTESSSAPCRGS